MKGTFACCCALLLATATMLCAATGSFRGIVHDPTHRPISGAQITLRTPDVKTVRSDANGEFEIVNVPEGAWPAEVSADGFRTLDRQVIISASQTPAVHLQLDLASLSSSVDVSDESSRLNPAGSTVRSMVSSDDIAQTPGADQSNSLSMITDFTPGATMVHDMLHVRMGHQVNWFFDGIPVVNTNIAANVASLINPKNVLELEVERGGYSSQYGDRTYGFFNVVTPSGFERNNEAEIVSSLGNFYTTDDQFDLGGHTQKFAWYASVDGNRSELGLATPVSQVIHDQTSAAGGFLSLLYNPSAKDQLRWIVSLREDHYQIPNTQDDQTVGIRDIDLERDYLAGFTWTHTLSDDVTFTLAPYFHFNSAQYLGGPNDTPYVLNDRNRSNYFGARSVIQALKKRHEARAGLEVWGQHDNTFFGLGGAFVDTQRTWASSTAMFLEDQYRATSWLTLTLGLRLTHYAGLVNENAADPRIGASIRIPHVGWTVHGYYAYYYQPPPLDSIAGPALVFAVAQGYGFTPLHGERDIQHDIGLTIPLGPSRTRWSLDIDNYHTSARNFLDHDVIGNSGIFVPLTDLGAIISGTEVSLRSPQLWHMAQWRVAYANAIGQGIGPITGGLLEDAPSGNFLLDHDQRNTLSSVLSLTLPGHAWITPAWQLGSGFLNGDGPSHLPPHSTFDVALGKTFREKLTVSVNAVNIANTRYLLDTSNTFGGTHYINPRQIYGEVRYRFHF